MECIRLAVSSHIDTPFHRNYTIVNSISRFVKEIRDNPNVLLIKHITGTGFEPDEYKTLVALFPWISINLEFETEFDRFENIDISAIRDLELTPENHQYFKDQLSQDNYSIKELNITYDFDRDFFNIIPRLKGLKSINISPITPEVLNALKFVGIANLKIKELFLQECSPQYSGGHLYQEIKELFMLEEIETFGFSEFSGAGYPDLECIIQSLSKLKYLFIQEKSRISYEVTTLVPQDSLKFLCLHDSSVLEERGDFIDYDELMKCIEPQENTLTTLCLSNGIFHFMGNSWIDRVYLYEHKHEDNAETCNLQLIEQILQNGTRFLRLNTIILNEIYYFIKRNGTGSIEIVPLEVNPEFEYSREMYIEAL